MRIAVPEHPDLAAMVNNLVEHVQGQIDRVGFGIRTPRLAKRLVPSLFRQIDEAAAPRFEVLVEELLNHSGFGRKLKLPRAQCAAPEPSVGEAAEAKSAEMTKAPGDRGHRNRIWRGAATPTTIELPPSVWPLPHGPCTRHRLPKVLVVAQAREPTGQPFPDKVEGPDDRIAHIRHGSISFHLRGPAPVRTLVDLESAFPPWIVVQTFLAMTARAHKRPDSGQADPPAPVDRLAARAGTPRVPGARAMRTRQRLLVCVAELIEEVPYRDVTSALVTQRIGLSQGAFYRYFADINDAILELTPAMRAASDSIATIVSDSTWDGPAAHRTALAVIDAMAAFWSEHRVLYRVTDLCADEGDERFSRVKASTFAGLTNAFRDVIAAFQRIGQHPDDVEPFAAACVVVAMLIHTTARETGFGLAGVGPQTLRAHVAKVVEATVTGVR
jgi:AcrR family transcriptional regulator